MLFIRYASRYYYENEYADLNAFNSNYKYITNSVYTLSGGGIGRYNEWLVDHPVTVLGDLFMEYPISSNMTLLGDIAVNLSKGSSGIDVPDGKINITKGNVYGYHGGDVTLDHTYGYKNYHIDVKPGVIVSGNLHFKPGSYRVSSLLMVTGAITSDIGAVITYY